MRVISNKTLTDFGASHEAAQAPLQTWRKLVEAGVFNNFSDIKRVFNATDKVGEYFVFDIGGNKYRLIAAIHFNRQMLFIRHVFSHKEYDQWKP